MKNGVIEPATNFLLSMTLVIIFFIGAYVFLFTDTGAKTVDAANYYVLSKLGIAINPAKLEKLTQGTLLNAKITTQPESPVCANEPVYFSANSTSLPPNTKMQDAKCFWDFDAASEPCSFYNDVSQVPQGLNCAPGSPANNSDTTDDYSATDCNAVSYGPWPESDVAVGDKKQGVQLVVVAGGKTDTDLLLVKSALTCVCAGTKLGCSNAPNPGLPVTLKSGQYVNVSFKSDWNPAGIHIVIEPIGDLSNLTARIGPDRVYKMVGNLTSPTIVYGQGLLSVVEQNRTKCTYAGMEPCIVPVSFDFSGTGSIRIKEIWIPLGLPTI